MKANNTEISFLAQWRAEANSDHPLNHWLTSMFEKFDPFWDEYRVETFDSLDDAKQAIDECVLNFGEFRVLQIETKYTEIFSSIVL